MISLKDLDVGSIVPYMDHKLMVMERSGPVDNPMVKIVCVPECCSRPMTIHMPENDLIELINIVLDKYGTIKMRKEIADVMQTARKKQSTDLIQTPIHLSEEIESPFTSFKRFRYMDADLSLSKYTED
jgi:hypothetical protein